MKSTAILKDSFAQPVKTRGKILIAENRPEIGVQLAQRLNRLGYQVIALARSGFEAIQKTDHLRPHIALVNMQLQGRIDGIETAEQIHAGFQIPVVYITADSDDYTLQRAKMTDPFGYVFEPFVDRELEIMLELALSRHHTQKECESLIAELQEALAEVRRLSGLLPICLSCKKIRDDRGYWNRVEEYISKVSRARFTHGYCPDCARRLTQGIRARSAS